MNYFSLQKQSLGSGSAIIFKTCDRCGSETLCRGGADPYDIKRTNGIVTNFVLQLEGYRRVTEHIWDTLSRKEMCYLLCGI